jgi:hypothetical protein
MGEELRGPVLRSERAPVGAGDIGNGNIGTRDVGNGNLGTGDTGFANTGNAGDGNTGFANAALLANYMASMVTQSDGHSGTAITNPQMLGDVQPLVAPPHP